MVERNTWAQIPKITILGSDSMYIDIEKIDLHDAELITIETRSTSNFVSHVCMTMNLKCGSTIEVVFSDCFSTSIKLAQWIIGSDSIRDWSFDMTQDQMDEVRHFEDQIHMEIGKKLCYFSARTNITNSSIEIACRSIIATSV